MVTATKDFQVVKVDKPVLRGEWCVTIHYAGGATQRIPWNEKTKIRPYMIDMLVDLEYKNVRGEPIHSEAAAKAARRRYSASLKREAKEGDLWDEWTVRGWISHFMEGYDVAMKDAGKVNKGAANAKASQ